MNCRETNRALEKKVIQKKREKIVKEGKDAIEKYRKKFARVFVFVGKGIEKVGRVADKL